MVSAVILIRAQLDSINELAQALVAIPGVTQVFSVAGHYDLVALLHAKENEDLADLVSVRIRKLTGIVATETLIAFRVYSRAELEAGFSLGVD